MRPLDTRNWRDLNEFCERYDTMLPPEPEYDPWDPDYMEKLVEWANEIEFILHQYPDR